MVSICAAPSHPRGLLRIRQLLQLALQPLLRLGDRGALGVLRRLAHPLQLSGFCLACRLLGLCGLVLGPHMRVFLRC